MKTIAAHLATFLNEPEGDANVRLLARIIALVVGVVLAFSLLFQVVMSYEGREGYSFIDGLYWTLVTMSTLGYGDIVFETHLGRVFSMVAMTGGVMLLLVVFPFAFIQFFYAPWLQVQMRNRAPRRMAPGTSDHVIIGRHDSLGSELAARFAAKDQPYVIVEPDPQLATTLHQEGISVAVGAFDDVRFLKELQVRNARLVVANLTDQENTNLALTAREIAPDVSIAAVAAREASHDILELSGVTHVLPLKRWLGEQLANRVASSHAQSHVVGRYRDLLLAELPVRNTPLAGKTVRQARLREISGVSVVGAWTRGRLMPIRPDTVLSNDTTAVVVGKEAQLDQLDEILLIYNVNHHPVIVIGGGNVGQAAAARIRAKEMPVHLVEQDAPTAERLRATWTVFEGDAADYNVLKKAGILEAPAVVVSTHDDAMNIYLTAYCRRLNKDLRVVSRVTHQRNVESVHRAGADFVLSYTEIGAAAVISAMSRQELSLLGAHMELFTVPLPYSLIGKTLSESNLGGRTGMLVLAIELEDDIITNPPADTVMHAGSRLVMIGDDERFRKFEKAFAAA